LSSASFITVKLNNTRLRALLDTGSHYSLLSEETARKLKVSVEPLSCAQALFSANGSPLNIAGQSTITLCISSLKVIIDVLIVKNLSEILILGRTFLQQGSAVLNFADNVVTFNQLIDIPMHQIDKNASLARLTQSHCVPGNSEIICYVSCHPRFNNNDVLLTPIPGKQFAAYAVANSCNHVQKNLTLCRILNFNDTPLVLCKNQKMCQIQEYSNDQKCMSITHNIESKIVKVDEDENVTEQQLEEFANQFNFNLNPELTKDVRIQALRVLFRRKEAFARDISELKIYNKELFEIKLKDTSPMIQKQYPLKEEHARILEEHISDWLKDDIIEPSRDYFHSNPIFLVAKQSLHGATDKLDKKHYRPVLDMRCLNLRLEPFVVYTPSPKELLDKITKFSKENGEEHEKRAAWFSTTDMFSGFLQLGLKPGISRTCTTFHSPSSGESYCFRRVPFGMRVSSGLFLTVLNRVLAPMRQKGGLSFYCDDVIIYTVTVKEHLSLLDQMLSRLIDNGLKASVSKSYFLYNSVKYLGVIISADGISIPKSINRTLDKIQSMKINTRRKLLSVLGFLQYWKAHIFNLASRTYHMRLLTKKDAILKWDQNCQNELDDVINSLKIADPLMAINPFQPLLVVIDSSHRGIGVSFAQSTQPYNTKTDIEKQIKVSKPVLQP
jgi:Reverse transcriptase (RNA-dependent DNA polymerase)/gag-polyprotein putative aspartyl protease